MAEIWNNDSVLKNITKFDKEELEKMFSSGELFFIDEKLYIPNICTSQNN